MACQYLADDLKFFHHQEVTEATWGRLEQIRNAVPHHKSACCDSVHLTGTRRTECSKN